MPLQLRRGTDAERTAGGGVVFLEGELIYITDTEEVYVGDGVTPGGLLITGSSGLTNVVDDTTPALGGNLDLNNFDITGIGDIDITGTVTGDVQGSVFGDDSTVLVDAVNNTLSADTLTTPSIVATNNLLEVAGAVDTSSTQLRINSGATKASEIHFGRGNSLASDLSGDTIPHGRITFSRNDSINDVVTTAFIIARNDILTLFHNPTGNTSDEPSYVTMKDANFGIGTLSPTEKLDVRGSGVFTGEVVAAAFKGTLVGDDSTILVDAVNGTIPYPININPDTSAAYLWDGLRPETVADALDRLTLYTQDFAVTNAGDWNGTAPASIIEAIDRLATVVKTLNGGTGA